jgi:hypothetical protein
MYAPNVYTVDMTGAAVASLGMKKKEKKITLNRLLLTPPHFIIFSHIR